MAVHLTAFPKALGKHLFLETVCNIALKKAIRKKLFERKLFEP